MTSEAAIAVPDAAVLTAPESVRALVRRAPVQSTIELMRGNLVVDKTENLGGAGGRRNIEWVQERVSHYTEQQGPGLFVVAVGEREATWNTAWEDAPPDRHRGIPVMEHYENLASRTTSSMFTMLREVRDERKANASEIRS